MKLLLLLLLSANTFCQVLKPDNDVLLPGNRQRFTVSGACDSAVNYSIKDGRKAIQFRLSKDFPEYEEGYHSELGSLFWQRTPYQTVTFQTNFPSEGVPNSPQRFGFFDFHDMPDSTKGEKWWQPPITGYIENNRIYVYQVVKPAASITYDLGEVEKDRWTDWKIRVHFSTDSTGYLKVRKNGLLVINYTGVTSFNSTYSPAFKCGIYNWLGWKGLIDKIELFFANVVVR